MEDKKVSVIIPVYRSEQFLEECVKSVLDQTYPGVEIVLVDDGSPDSCPVLVDRYARDYPRIRALHQENLGMGPARNAGIRASDGEYIYFLDSDDCLDGEEAIAKLVQEAERTGADITMGNYRRMQNGEKLEVNRHHLQAGSYERTADFRFDGFYRFGHLAYNWGKLYRRSFLEKNDIWCGSYSFSEDKAFNMLCYAYHPKYAFLSDSVNLYRINQNSRTFQYKEDLMQVWISIVADFERILKERNLENECEDIVALHLFFASFYIIKQERQAGNGLWKAAAKMKQFGQEPLVKKAMSELARGNYIREISCTSWRFMIRCAAILFSLHGYFLYAVANSILLGMQVDQRITDRRNKGTGKFGRKPGKEVCTGGIGREAEALCALLKKALCPGEGEALSRLLGGAALEDVLRMAEQHKVLPMLYDVLEQSLEEIPPRELSLMQQSAEKTVKQSYRLLFLTKQLTDLLEQGGIRTIVLKGSGVAARYPVPEYRKSGDVDLLLENDREVERAARILEEHGYFLKEEQHANHHVAYSTPEGIDVEMHTMLAEPFDDEAMNDAMGRMMGDCFGERKEQDCMGVMLPVASDALQAMSILLHMLQHFLRAGFGLKLLADWVVFWNSQEDPRVCRRFERLTGDCGLTGFAKAVTMICETYLGLEKNIIYEGSLENDFSEGFAQRFLMDIMDAEEFGKADPNRMVALRRRDPLGYLKEFHYQMRMNYPEESKQKRKWPLLWIRAFVVFVRNNRRLGRGSLRNILKKAGERARVVEEMKLFSK